MQRRNNGSSLKDKGFSLPPINRNSADTKKMQTQYCNFKNIQ